MKIAVTGGTAGIGQALANEYESRGHEVLRLSRRNGHNIRSIAKIAGTLESCDMFINNAQEGFAQTELLFEMAARWQGTKKHIVVISTMMTQWPTSVMTGLEMTQYYVQKKTLEEAVKQLRGLHLGVKYTLVKPGDIGTSPDKKVPPSADVSKWAKSLVEILESEFLVDEISMVPRNDT